MSEAAVRDRIDVRGIALLRDRLRDANIENPEFDARFHRLAEVIEGVLYRVDAELGDTLDRVMAVGEWVRDGIDLRTLPCDDVVVLIVVRMPERPFDLYLRLADRVFADLDDDDIGVQFRLESVAEWAAGVEAARHRGAEDALGVPLLIRSYGRVPVCP